MKELVILSDVVKEENEVGSFRVIKFTFDGFEGKVTTMTLCGLQSNDVIYRLAYAAWDRQGYISQNTFMSEVDDIFHYSEFLVAFKEKFGIEIPLK
jgi:hypothetical protein